MASVSEVEASVVSRTFNEFVGHGMAAAAGRDFAAHVLRCNMIRKYLRQQSRWIGDVFTLQL